MPALKFHLDPLQSCFHPCILWTWVCQGYRWLACAESNDQFPRANSSFWHSWFCFPLWCPFFIWLSTFSWFPFYLTDDSCSASFSGFLSSPCLLKLEGYRAPFLVSSYLFSGLREKWQIDDRYIHTFLPTEIKTQIHRHIDRCLMISTSYMVLQIICWRLLSMHPNPTLLPCLLNISSSTSNP